MEEALSRLEQRKGKKSKALADKPQLGFSDQLIWDAFSILHRSRNSGFSPGPISIQDIIAIAFMTVEETRDLIVIIKMMDDVWQSDFAERNSS